MDLRRLRAGEWLVGAAGLLLLGSLFVDWYDGRTGWQSLGALDVVICLLALSALAIPLVTAVHRVPAVPLAHQSLTTLAGILVFLLVLVRVLNLPDWASDRQLGLWLGLLGTLAVVAGGLVAMRDERLTRGTRHTDLTGVPVTAPREIERLPAPRPEGRS